MKSQITGQTKKKRAIKFKKLNQELQQKSQKKMLGNKTKVLWEGKKNGWWYGYTENYMKVKCRSKKNLTNKIQVIIVRKNNLTLQ